MLLFRFCSMGVEYKYIGVFLYKVVFFFKGKYLIKIGGGLVEK